MKSIIEQASSLMKAIEKAWNQAEQPTEFSIKIFEKEERNFFGMSVKPAKVAIFFGDKPIIHEKTTQKPRPEIKECRSSFAKATEDRSSFVKTSSSAKASAFAKATADKSADITADKIENKPTVENKQAKPAASKPAPKQQQPSPAKTAEDKRKNKSQTTSQQQNPPPYSAEATKGKLQEKKQTQQVNNHHEKAEKEAQPRRAPAAWNDAMITSADEWLKRTLVLMNMPSIQFNSEIAGKNLKLLFNAPLVADAGQEKQLLRSFAHLIMSSLRNQYKQEIKDLKVILIRAE